MAGRWGAWLGSGLGWRALALAAALLAWPGGAQAAWIKAETERFVVYGDGSEKTVREYAVKLSQFDELLRLFHPVPAEAEPIQKLPVYLVNSRMALRRVRPDIKENTIGMYVATGDGVFAMATGAGEAMGRDEVLFHEYAHHFMLQHFPVAYPGWFVEGWAEYFMTARMTPKGMRFGEYNEHRVAWLNSVGWLPMEKILSKRVSDFKGQDVALYYAQAWLLVHYMIDNPKREGQLDKASRAIADGEEPVKAFTAATGMDMVQLRRALQSYTRINIHVLAKPLPTPNIVVTQLPASADDVLLDGLRVSAEKKPKSDAQFMAGLRTRAARHPGDRLAELTLARAEFAMGDVAAGEALIKRRLEADPNDVEALRIAGTGQVRAGQREPSQRVARFRAARPLLMKAYQLEKTDYRILANYAVSRTVEANFPTENDANALLEAHALAPAVGEISFFAGSVLMARGKKDLAVRILRAVANDPHGGEAALAAQAIIDGKRPDPAAATEAPAKPE